MLTAALGDALGAHWRKRGGILRYTDDTAMTIALAESIIERGRVDPIHVAEKFIEHYEKEPWRGYGPGPPRIFRIMRRKGVRLELDKLFYPGGSYGNGAAMRITPVALFYYDNLTLLRKAVEASCKPTHSNPLAIEGAYLEAAAIALALKINSDQKTDTKRFIEALRREAHSKIYMEKLKLMESLLLREISRDEVIENLGNSVEAFNSVPAAIYSYLREQYPVETIEYAISLGGDTDTIACMAGAIAGVHKGAETIPLDLLERLENRERIERLAEKLWKLKRKYGKL